MTDTRAPKVRRKKDMMRDTDDVAHTLAAMPAGGMAHGVNGGFASVATDGIDDDERRRMIAEAAYYRALRRGFANGSPETDWLEAEAEIVARLGGTGVRA